MGELCKQCHVLEAFSSFSEKDTGSQSSCEKIFMNLRLSELIMYRAANGLSLQTKYWQ